MTAAPEISIQISENAKRDELIVNHLDLVHAMASSVQRSIGVHTELDDLIHAGTMGLFDAATKYRDDKEVAFPAYAKHRIRGATLDSLRQLDWASRDARRQYKQMQTVTRDLSTKLRRTPTHAEIAEAMGLDQDRWNALMINVRMLGLAANRESSHDSEERPAREIPSKPADCPDHAFARTELRSRLNSAMSYLPERHQQVVKMYYEGDMTMKEIGTRLGVNESRVSQIHKSALGKMHSVLGGAGILSIAALA
ncbi:MAG TPA: FliA/WhiG family RNA polymerase sigma factor [Bryobacteraceae bacterium]|nr:FliA/WhiG family RNA polymerase sigma factor [Bryobacteraceae bacterium]